MRSLVAIAVTLLLGGCNMVFTTEPLFTPADAGGASPLRPGVWNGAPDPACPFDEAQPMSAWPACANGGVVSASAIRAFRDMNGASSGTAYVLAGGDPRVMQLHGLELDPGSGLSFTNYFYVGLRPTKTDGQGRITAYDAWVVQCGPPPDAKGGQTAYGTKSPLPGMVMDKSGQNCATASARDLRAAAVASKAWSSSPMGAHWVRDGDH